MCPSSSPAGIVIIRHGITRRHFSGGGNINAIDLLQRGSQGRFQFRQSTCDFDESPAASRGDGQKHTRIGAPPRSAAA